MAHPRRLAAAERLAAQDPQGRVRVVLDPDPTGPPTSLRTAALAWSSVPQGSTHHLVLEDDVFLAEGFFAHAERAAEAMPDTAIAFYANWNSRNGAAVRMAAAAGADWVSAMNEYAPCVTLMLPAGIARGYADFARTEGKGWPYDVMMYRYLRSAGVPVRIAVPNTVEHGESPSLAGNATHGLRRSALFTGRADEPGSGECADFDLVPFYKHGFAQCAVRRDGHWEIVEAERQLHRMGLSTTHCRELFVAARPSTVPEVSGWAVWLTAYLIGTQAETVSAGRAAALATIGPGGLCDELSDQELAALTAPMAELALAALAAGQQQVWRLSGKPTRTRADRMVVTGAGGPFAGQLSRLLADLGHEVSAQPGPLAPADLDGVAAVVHLGGGGPEVLASVLAAAEAAQVGQLVYAGSAAVYAGWTEPMVDERAVVEAPEDPVARGWWQEEQLCRQWSERTGAPHQVLRFAAPVGPHGPTDAVFADWIRLAWTRKPLPLSPPRRHQLVDYRDMVSAIDTVLRARPQSAIFNIATVDYAEQELAELVHRIARPTGFATGADRRTFPLMATDLATKELGWSGSMSVTEAMRAFAQWLAYDVDWSA